MACVLRPSRFISKNSCMSLPLSTRGPPPRRIGRLYTLVRGWGIFNRLSGDFCTGSDNLFGIHTLSEELIVLYEHYARGTPLKRLPIPLRNQAYVSELQRLTYPDDLVGREHDRI